MIALHDSDPEIYDVVGIGFGPANLSLAIALQESPEPLSSAFFERQPALSWHRGMLVPNAKMQVSFLKDLVTFRSPASTFSFVSFLHDTGRLARFVNNQDFFPTRREFHAYLQWAEARLARPVTYNTEVAGVRLPAHGGPALLELRDPARPAVTRTVAARTIVISTGLVPRMPAGVEPDERVWHSSQFLPSFRRYEGPLRRVAVVGAGQSAAEIVRFLHDALPDADVFAIMPAYGYAIADNTPFANQVFDPSAVDDYYHGSQRAKDAFWHYHRNTNYAVVDDEVLRELYQRAYDDEVAGRQRLHFVNLARVIDVKRLSGGPSGDTRITVHSLSSEESYPLDVDVLVCATGYDPMNPADLLGDLGECVVRDEAGQCRVDRDYRLVTTADLPCDIYLQGGTEHTHGLSSSLLSNIATRSGEIAQSITARRAAARRSEGVRA